MKNEQIYFFKEYIKEFITYPDQKKQEEESKGYNAGDEVIYLRDGHKKEEFDPKKPVEEQTEIVGLKVIKKIKNGKYIFEDQDGEEFSKEEEEILQKVTPKSDEEESESEELEEDDDKTEPTTVDQSKVEDKIENEKPEESGEELEEESSNESVQIKKFIDFL